MLIITNDLAFNTFEAPIARLLDQVFVPEAVKKIPVHTKNVKHSIVELYAVTKNEVIKSLAVSKSLAPKSICLVTDFWSCPTTKSKYLGARV